MNSQAESLRHLWDLVRPVLLLAAILLGFQLIGMLVGLAFKPVDFIPADLWYGAAFASPPGFLAGAIFQTLREPGSLIDNKKVVVFMAVMSVMLPISGFYFHDFAVAEFGGKSISELMKR
jgi:hypothetical protein